MGLGGRGRTHDLRVRGLDHHAIKSGVSKVRRGPTAERVIRFIGALQLTAGKHAGKKFKLREWQKKIVRGIYRGKVRTAVITMGRKNGKTQLATALAAAHLFGPMSEPRGEVYSAAADRNQAARVFRELEAMILSDDDLRSRCNIQRFSKRIEVLTGQGAGSVYEALSSDARKAHGLSPSFVVCDELAQWRGRELFDNLVTGTAARDNPLVVVISTISSDPNHILSELLSHGEQIQQGLLPDDESFHTEVFSTPMDADIWDEKNWYAANPALDDFRSLDELRKFAEQAKSMPAREAVMRNLYLNQPIEPLAHFISRTDWNACATDMDWNFLRNTFLRGKKCFAGLDLSSTTDLTALVLYFPESGYVLPYFWTPEENLKAKEKTDRVPLGLWHRQGYLQSNPGRAIDRYSIVRKVAEITKAFDLQGMAYDRYGFEALKKMLDEEGIDINVTAWGQGHKDMSPACDALEAAVLNRHLKHSKHPILTWNMANAVVYIDPAGNRKLDKSRSVERIDGAVALAMALGLAAKTPQKKEIQFFTLGDSDESTEAYA